MTNYVENRTVCLMRWPWPILPTENSFLLVKLLIVFDDSGSPVAQLRRGVI